MDLQVSTARRGHFAVLTVVGEVDFDTAGSLADGVSTAIGEGPENLVLDLGGVTFFDSSGVKVLVSTLKRTEQTGRSLSLVAVPHVVMRVLTVTALDTAFTIHDSVDDVVGSDPQPD
jgi:anti-sigma B factor antagonist